MHRSAAGCQDRALRGYIQVGALIGGGGAPGNLVQAALRLRPRSLPNTPVLISCDSPPGQITYATAPGEQRAPRRRGVCVCCVQTSCHICWVTCWRRRRPHPMELQGGPPGRTPAGQEETQDGCLCRRLRSIHPRNTQSQLGVRARPKASPGGTLPREAAGASGGVPALAAIPHSRAHPARALRAGRSRNGCGRRLPRRRRGTTKAHDVLLPGFRGGLGLWGFDASVKQVPPPPPPQPGGGRAERRSTGGRTAAGAKQKMVVPVDGAGSGPPPPAFDVVLLRAAAAGVAFAVLPGPSEESDGRAGPSPIPRGCRRAGCQLARFPSRAARRLNG